MIQNSLFDRGYVEEGGLVLVKKEYICLVQIILRYKYRQSQLSLRLPTYTAEH